MQEVDEKAPQREMIDEEEDDFAVDMTEANVTFPEGPYVAEITAAKRDVNRNSGERQGVITCVFQQGEYAGKKLTKYMSMENTKLGYMWQGLYLAVGQSIVDASGRPLQRIVPDFAAMIGKQVIIDVKDNEWLGRVTSQIHGFKPYDPNVAKSAPAATTGGRRQRQAA